MILALLLSKLPIVLHYSPRSFIKSRANALTAIILFYFILFTVKTFPIPSNWKPLARVAFSSSVPFNALVSGLRTISFWLCRSEREVKKYIYIHKSQMVHHSLNQVTGNKTRMKINVLALPCWNPSLNRDRYTTRKTHIFIQSALKS